MFFWTFGPPGYPKLITRDAKAVGTDWLIGFFLNTRNSCPNSPQQGKANPNNLESDQACEPKLCNHSLVDLRTDGSSTKMPFALMLLTLAKSQRKSPFGWRTSGAAPYRACCALGSPTFLKTQVPCIASS